MITSPGALRSPGSSRASLHDHHRGPLLRSRSGHNSKVRANVYASRRKANAAQSPGGDLLFEETTRAIYAASYLGEPKRYAFVDGWMCGVGHVPIPLRTEANFRTMHKSRGTGFV